MHTFFGGYTISHVNHNGDFSGSAIVSDGTKLGAACNFEKPSA